MPANKNYVTQIATAVINFNFIEMKKLSRDEMKNVMGGTNAGCGQYQGQTTFICGTRVSGGACYVDICYCNGTVVPGGCEVPSEDLSDCG